MSTTSETPQVALPFLSGGGEMGALMRAKDWSNTPIGAAGTWSPALRMMVSFLLANRFPLLLWWGAHYVSIYNDAYRPILGQKHPNALGQPVSECWHEIWDVLQPLIDTPFRGGPATWMDDIFLEINRHGFVEETHFTIAYSPVPDDTAPRGIGGVLATVHEITDNVVGERRVAALRDLGAHAAEAKTAEDACAVAAETLGNYARDIPFALLYLRDGDGKRARLAGTAGLAPGEDASPREIDLIEPPDSTIGWPLAAALRSEAMVTVENIGARFARTPPGPWSDPPHTAVVVPVRSNRAHELAGFLVAGVSPRLKFDALYRTFFDLVATQIATSVANARAYEEERKRAEALAEIDRAKTIFFSNASHEFRTPLALMLSPLEDMLARTLRSESILADRGEVELIHRNGLRLLKLVNALLDFSRIESGRIQATYEPIDLAAFTMELASTFRSAMERAGLRYVVDCPPLPEPVFVDRDMWEKIVLNLVSNAFKYTLEGEVALRLRAVGDAVELTIADTGVGVPEHALPHLFERFYRVEEQRGRTQEGTGIGLALVQELARLHGGSVRAESVLGCGTTFIVSLPFGKTHLPVDRIGAERTQASTSLRADAFLAEALRWLPDANGAAEPLIERELIGAPSCQSSPAIRSFVLLADDNADMRDYVRRLLAGRHEVEAVADGRAALEAARRRRPDLVLSDVMMPRLDGFGLLRALRADPALCDIPVVLLSARAGEEAKVEGLEAGADDYLTKPFTARELVARVDTNLRMARLRREGALRESELRSEAEFMRTRFETVLEHLPMAVSLADAEGRILFTNPALERMLGHHPIPTAEVEEFRQWPAFHPDGRHYESDEYPLARALKGELVHDLDLLYRRGNGAMGWLRSSAIPIRDAHDRVAGAVGVTIDIDRQKRAEAELQQLNETLERRVADEIRERMKAEETLRQAQKMEAIGQLTGGVAHDFNNLLTVIFGNLDALQRRYRKHRILGEDGDFHRLTEAALRGAERAATLTQRLLAFSRRQPLAPKPINANKLVVGMSDLLRRTLGEEVAIETVLAGGLWWISADSNQLENALLNLAVNARDAMPDGGRLTIETANTRLDEAYAETHGEVIPGQYVMIAVGDTGTGMSKEILTRAFEPFFTTKGISHGTGLGLSQVYGFVKQSGGHVKLHSAPGEGTTVRLYLPRLVADAAPSESVVPAQSAPMGTPEATILVVEDDDDVRAHSVDIVRELGYRVLQATDGRDALRILDAEPDIQLLFTDVGLPGGLNGRQLAEEARRRHPGLKVLFATAYARDAIFPQGRLDFGVDLIVKPFTYANLGSKIRGIIDSAADASP